MPHILAESLAQVKKVKKLCNPYQRMQVQSSSSRLKHCGEVFVLNQFE